jgi:hypothetical protein
LNINYLKSSIVVCPAHIDIAVSSLHILTFIFVEGFCTFVVVCASLFQMNIKVEKKTFCVSFVSRGEFRTLQTRKMLSAWLAFQKWWRVSIRKCRLGAKKKKKKKKASFWPCRVDARTPFRLKITQSEICSGNSCWKILMSCLQVCLFVFFFFCFFFFFFFLGYKLPHPLEHKIVVKVETTSDSKPEKAMGLALARLKDEFQNWTKTFAFK